ncbi:SDR family NAD(P)-dependent oxidoreductase [Chloroflexota bacterium]
MSLEGKVALVTGASGMHGIGRAVAIGLAKAGADIAVSGRLHPADRELPEEESKADWKGIESVADEVRKLGRKCAPIYCDLSREEEIIKLIDETVSQLGGLHIFVNNARSIIGKDRVPVVDLDVKEWDKVMAVNLRGTFLCCKYGALQMIKQGDGGRIIIMSSTAAKRGAAMMAAYCTSKFGGIGFTQSLAHELAPYNITVNAVCPGVTDTHRFSFKERDMAEKEGITLEEMQKRTLTLAGANIPLGRVAESEDVAAVITFLASPEASYLTGISINVAGGEVMD